VLSGQAILADPVWVQSVKKLIKIYIIIEKTLTFLLILTKRVGGQRAVKADCDNYGYQNAHFIALHCEISIKIFNNSIVNICCPFASSVAGELLVLT